MMTAANPIVCAASGYLSTVLGSRPGYLAVAIGLHPHRDEKGNYRHQRWDEKIYRWPEDLSQMAVDAATAMKDSDVYVCPAIRREPERRRKIRGNGSAVIVFHTPCLHRRRYCRGRRGGNTAPVETPPEEGA